MDQKDYILREIERLGYILARIRDRILGRATSLGAVRQELHAAAGMLGVDLEIAQQVTPATLLLLVGAGGSVEPTRCWFLAESLYLQGLEARLAGTAEEGADLLLRARLLFQLLHERNFRLVEVTEAAERIQEIDALLGARSPP